MQKWSENMGVIQTDQWLKVEFDRPTEICEKLLPYFKGQNANEIYNQLMKFGMYRPSRSSKMNLDRMIEQKVWKNADQLFQHYKNKWAGPDIPIFLFPLDRGRGLFFRQESNKSGVSYPDKMFLFLSDVDDTKELEALLVHEYHHVCRLKMLNKKMEEYTLLDSIIIEGLAEYAVLKNCGSEYLAKWCSIYTKKDLISLWDKYLKSHLSKRKNERAHDNLLFGEGRIPKLLGYAAGFAIVENYYKNHTYSTKLSFSIPASKFLEGSNEFG
ncbi:DUF2268 domain-containing putative Zn-dependent protease [Neobacillus ginsengisoli]|uniref:Uncharacterized protein YjaZ n=1 Tax=Neobacillus ginsengisoli TaxID=904295 RepID=A0ABT9XRJ3_9BACI|nr:DUF2268 domain-containing protein [Neobacillus ginsengisoli]MDQ0198175.1 uncharacterized protein YjaZ [Neobacillus ginsengisoli]